MKSMVISQKAPFMRTRRYIFLTEWQLCAKHVDPAECPGQPSNRQLVAQMDPRVPKIEAKLLAQQGVLVILLPLNKEICHFSWQEQDCVSFWTNRGVCDPWSNTGRFISDHSSWRPVCPSKENWWLGATKLMLTEVQATAGHVWTSDKVKRWNPPGFHREAEEWSSMWRRGCLNLIRILNWGTDFAPPRRSTHFCQEESCAVCF